MNRPVLYLVGVAAAVMVAVGAWNLLPRSPSVGGNASPTPSVTPAPTTAAVIPELHDGQLPAGTYFTKPYETSPTLRLRIPERWVGFGNFAVGAPEGLAAPNGLGIALLQPNGLFSDPCHWDQLGTNYWPQPADVATGPTAADLATALRAQTAYTTSVPADVTVGGYAGKRLDLTMPQELDVSTCDTPNPSAPSVPAYMPFGQSDAGGSNLYAQGSAQVWHLWILDVGPTRLVIVIADYAGTAPATYAAAEAIVQSIVITP